MVACRACSLCRVPGLALVSSPINHLIYQMFGLAQMCLSTLALPIESTCDKAYPLCAFLLTL